MTNPMKKITFSPIKLIAILLVCLATGALLLTKVTSTTAEAKNNGPDRLVVFTASWCASCRTLVPSLQEVATSLALPVEIVDVDGASAEATAKAIGVALPSKELPQGFYVQGNGSTLVFDGTGYTQNDATKAKTTTRGKILQNQGG
jgi:thiol-disulfide isomerase/thioredoxin